ncbi:hypothetical protein CAMGR0001_0872 [Campylobacter gracilis RM3268]|uniref:Uncharacterized protein n=1 Tax=Campylobacter gracilis RM3268 TaxID=553220 RepID=C8PG79_9BACT|nr:hypothetical protein CAMGR0001_0872 [Campylobacter gracilis RM3268]
MGQILKFSFTEKFRGKLIRQGAAFCLGRSDKASALELK